MAPGISLFIKDYFVTSTFSVHLLFQFIFALIETSHLYLEMQSTGFLAYEHPARGLFVALCDPTF